MVHLVESTEDMESKLVEAGDKLVVVDFFATWCGPCKMIAPQLEELSKNKTDIVFLKVDVDENEELATRYDIKSMPTFVFIKNGKVLSNFSGASMPKILESIELHQ